MIGRSHGIHAEPITAGLVFAGSLQRGRSGPGAALVQAREEIAVGKIAGAVGTYANLDPAIERAGAGHAGPAPETVPTQVVARDRHAGYFAALARLGTAVERLALTVRHWQRTEVGEAMEAFGKGQKGSLGHAPQEEPDPVREPVRPGAACCATTPAPPSRTWPCGTSGTSRTRRSNG